MGQKNIWQMTKNFPKLCEKHELTYLNSLNSKQDYYQENHTWAHHSQRDENTKMKSKFWGQLDGVNKVNIICSKKVVWVIADFYTVSWFATEVADRTKAFKR